ncbi:MAG: hypothetical protein ACOYBY_08660 [Dermatophilaceae bacterium]
MRRTATQIVASLSPVLIGLAVLGACSSGSDTSASATASPTAAATATQGGRGGGQRTPGVGGLIAAVSGSTMQVQSQSKQTAVTWTASTTFTKAATGSVADVTVGSCVFVRAADATATGDTVAAGTVQVLPAASDGTCMAIGFGGGGGTPPSGMPTDMPAPTDAANVPGQGPGSGQVPTGVPSGNGGGGVAGKVTAVSNGSFTVARIMAGGEGTTSTASPVTVQTSASTTVTKTVPASSADAVVGQCATAQGQTGDTGAVSATSIALRAPVNGSCFGGGAARTTTGSSSG